MFLLTCSLTNRKSLEAVEDLSDRIERIKDAPRQCASIILVATKCDDVENRQITREELKEFAERNGISFCFEVSAKTGENVVELFTCAAERGTDILLGQKTLIKKLENGIPVSVSERRTCTIL